MFDYDSVEFNTYIEIVKERVNSLFSKEMLDGLNAENKLETILQRQNLLSEAIALVKNNTLPFYNDEPIYAVYAKITEPSCFLVNIDFTAIRYFLKLVKALKNLFNQKNNYPALSTLVDPMNTFDDFYNDLERIFDDDGYVKDNANDKIYSIRRQLYQLRKGIINTLNKVIYSTNSKYFINDNIITERYNRYLILCKSNFRNYIEGLVQDVSVSGQTYYVEPLSVVELNNKYRELKIEEEEEIRKIVDELNVYFKDNRMSFLNTFNLYKQFIYYIDLGMYFSSQPVCFPTFSNKILLKNIHHPIIYFNKDKGSIPIDFKMDDNISLAIITGPNAGGKTAAVKLVGLNCLIAKCGLPLFGEYAEMINFDNLLCDIGDNQSILMDLSSFTAHISNLKNILQYSGINTLVIMDEPGSNTEPKKGAALSLSIIRELMDRGCKVVVSSHYDEIKNEGLFNENVTLYAVDFDYEANIPKYRLVEGALGDSSPFIIAKKYGLPEYILRKAENIYDEIYSEREKSLDEVKGMQASLLKKLKFADELISNMKRLYDYINNKWETFDKYIKEREEKILLEAQYYLNKAKYLNKKSKKINKNDIEKTAQFVEERIDKLKETHEYPKNLDIGDKIFMAKIGKVAEIIELKGDKVLINLDNKKINIDKRDLLGEKIKEEKREIRVVKGELSKEVPEINIIGKSIDEAYELLDNFIDKMILGNVDRFYIIHGRGTGALRKGVHNYLKRSKFIKNFKLASVDEGGSAITIVEI
jgi:DNA mismatch repair protein MutS2